MSEKQRPDRAENSGPIITAIQSAVSFFDQEEIIKNCTVQILTNSQTGEVSVGWWRNEA